MGNLTDYAKRELESFGAFDKDKDFYGGMTGESVMALVELFASQGHSGMSAPIVLKLFGKVVSFLPLGPLTGEDSEWNEVGDDTFQNNRCSEVFKKGKDGAPYHSGCKVFVEPSGAAYVNGDSRVFIEFPYVPKKIYVKVDEKGIVLSEEEQD